MDWDSRFVLGWIMGRNMDVGLCLKSLEMALSSGRPPIVFITDQGSQYTSSDWQKAIRAEGIQISMDGKGRWADNIIMERFWRTYKHEFFLHREPRNLDEANEMTAKWLEYYNRERPHNKSPLQYREESGNTMAANFWRDFSASAQLAARPRSDRDAEPTLQKRAKNGLTSEDTEWYNTHIRLMDTRRRGA